MLFPSTKESLHLLSLYSIIKINLFLRINYNLICDTLNLVIFHLLISNLIIYFITYNINIIIIYLEII